MKRHSQHGVALVITLILLSVITFMAVTFLVVSRHEGSAVNTFSQQSAAKFAADEALQSAMGLIAGQMLATSNGLNSGLKVSTNYVQPYFVYYPGATTNLVTNVSYVDVNNNLLQGAALQQMIGNLEILPRAPVFITTNKNFPPDFRFYHDLNRNGMYDPSGPGLGFDVYGNQVVINYTGDPEWIGILNHPNFPHSASNLFIGRYAFFAVPAGNSEDLNYSHNQAKFLQRSTGSAANVDGFVRNQGVGSWEINLAGFLSSLNTNYWGISNGFNNYGYLPNNPLVNPAVTAAASGGTAFFDANSLLQYRYNSVQGMGVLNSLDVLFSRFNPFAYGLYASENIDGYCVGPLMLGTAPLTTGQSLALTRSAPWSGDDCPNPFFSTQDLFNPEPGMAGFSNRLYSAGTNINTVNPAVNNYNRYTFYRLFSQMGFNSAPEPAPYPHSTKLNLNYMNVNGLDATNFVPWQPVQFFANAANAMLTNAGFVTTNGFPITVTNIPIYPVNYYTPAVHRLLQLAANIYDASTNKGLSSTGGFAPGTAPGFDYPSVFRPTFGRSGTNVFINGYQEVGVNDPSLLNPEYALPDDIAILPSALQNINIYNVPWVVGARKGLPNFNEFSMQSISQITRKLQVIGGSRTNIQYTIGVSNVIGVEAWNSYLSNYTRSTDLSGFVNLSMGLSNDVSPIVIPLNRTMPWSYNISGGGSTPWPGRSGNRVQNTFQIPLQTNVVFLPDLVYHVNAPHFGNDNTSFDTGPLNVAPHFILSCTNRMRFVMVDHATQRVIDFVHFNLSGTNFTRDLTSELQGSDQGGDGGVWLTNAIRTPTGLVMQGLINQLQISADLNVSSPTPFQASDWIADELTVNQPNPNSKQAAMDAFRQIMGGSPGTMQTPFTPTRKVSVYYTWQANDPLVHYTLGDLTQISGGTNSLPAYISPPDRTIQTLPNIRQINDRYLPWNNTGNPKGTNADGLNASNLQVKDPLITQSDDWQFPNNKYPNIGWLGRVHRGTPWQTVYLKSPSTDITNWQNWTGNQAISVLTANGTNYLVADAQLTHPTNDWKILDLFTAAINPNASKGQLSVNQTNLAAWAAVLEGVFVLTNETMAGVTSLQPQCIDPSDVCYPSNSTVPLPTVPYIVSRINAVRGTNAGGVFTSLGQILSVPELSVASPYINTNVVPGTAAANLLTDAVYERIPQQVMSLLRVGTPRYVIFAYGQSLKPADHSIVQSGPYFGLCTNYQITGEAATRTVIRIENHPIPGRIGTNSPRAVIEQYNVMPPGD